MKQLIVFIFMLTIFVVATSYGQEPVGTEDIITIGSGLTTNPPILDTGTRLYNSKTEEYEGPTTIWVDCLSWATTQYSGYNVRSLYNVDDVIKALSLAVDYLAPQEEFVTYAIVDTRSEADKLRERANQLDQKKKDIEYIKNILSHLKK